MKQIDYVSKLLSIAQNDETEDPVFVNCARICLENLMQIGLMKNKELAKLCFVDASTITRFVKRLGFDGYLEFKDYFADYAIENSQYFNREIISTLDIQDLISDTKNTISSSEHKMADIHFDDVCHLIENANPILLCGNRYSQLICQDFQLKLLSLGIFAKTYKDIAIQLEELEKNQGLMVLFSASLSRAKEMLKMAKDYHWQILLITGSKEVIDGVDYCISYDDPSSLKWTKHSTNDFICMAMIVDQIVLNIAKRKLQNVQ